MISAARKASTYKRQFANSNDLDCVKGIWYQTTGSQQLTRSGRSLLQFFVTIARMGYQGIDAPIGAIANSLFRVLGQTRSERTIYRALNDLEEHGFILRRTFRIGENRMKCLIRFNPDSFRFLTQKKPTVHHINAQLTKGQSSEWRNIDLRVNSCNTDLYSKKPRAREQDRFKHWSHPIVFTLMCLLGKTPADRRLVDRVKTEILAEKCELEVIGGSGLDWGHLSKRWQKMAPAVREGIARADILPALRRTTPKAPAPAEYAQAAPTPRAWMGPAPNPVDLPPAGIRPPPPPEPVSPPEEHPPPEQLPAASPNKLDDDEFRILEKARRKLRP